MNKYFMAKPIMHTLIMAKINMKQVIMITIEMVKINMEIINHG